MAVVSKRPRGETHWTLEWNPLNPEPSPIPQVVSVNVSSVPGLRAINARPPATTRHRLIANGQSLTLFSHIIFAPQTRPMTAIGIRYFAARTRSISNGTRPAAAAILWSAIGTITEVSTSAPRISRAFRRPAVRRGARRLPTISRQS